MDVIVAVIPVEFSSEWTGRLEQLCDYKNMSTDEVMGITRLRGRKVGSGMVRIQLMAHLFGHLYPVTSFYSIV